jgi:hypothetical protein
MNANMNRIYIRKSWMVNRGIGSLTRAQEKRVSSFLFSPQGDENVVFVHFFKAEERVPGTILNRNATKNNHRASSCCQRKRQRCGNFNIHEISTRKT